MATTTAPLPGGAARETSASYAGYAALRDRLRAQLAAAPPGTPVRLAKRTSNLFRTRTDEAVVRLDAEGLDGVLSVDPVARTADVLGMTTYEHLVDATLAHGLMPLVVPQLKTITLGGAVTGLGIESSSFRNGLPHESVVELDVLTGGGEVVTATRDNEHADLYYGFPNSYGTLGYALRLKIELEPVRAYVRLRHVRFDRAEAAFEALADIASRREWRGEPVDFLDGVAFTPAEVYLTCGTFADSGRPTADYTKDDVFYRSVRERTDDVLRVRDYLWRWDTDWFWCSGAFGAQRPLVRRLWPRRLLRSDVYWKIVDWENRHGLKQRIDRARGLPARESVVQDVEVPVERAADFLRALDRATGMRPVWICPLRQRDPAATWNLYPLEPKTVFVNFGFWGTVPLAPGLPADHHNRAVERLVADHDGHKSLYSTAFYTREEFEGLYGGESYARLKHRYDPQHRLLDLYDKCVRRR
jgi:FAD/FMN-containing dehydrogenase